MNRTVAVIGGGAAGMMAALWARRAGAEVVLLEPNEKLGRKLYITGKGRCNLTNDTDPAGVLAHVPATGAFCTAPSRASRPPRSCDILKSWASPSRPSVGGAFFRARTAPPTWWTRCSSPCAARVWRPTT